jgi:hypothetical protein
VVCSGIWSCTVRRAPLFTARSLTTLKPPIPRLYMIPIPA